MLVFLTIPKYALNPSSTPKKVKALSFSNALTQTLDL